MREVRIYHEVLEQAEHFIKPAIRKSLGPNVPIKLVRLSRIRPTGSVVAESLAAGISIKDPDAFITVVDNTGTERPILVLEFSNAVETQDHDLQRFDALIAASKFKAPFVKLYAKKQSRQQHGGQRDYDRTISYRILTHRYKIPAFEVEWPLLDPYTACRDPKHKACPPPNSDFDGLISALLTLASSANPLSDELMTNSSLLPTALQKQLVQHNLPVPPPSLKGRSSRLFQEGKDVVLKFNRWGHAMDPERGMSWYYRELFGHPLVGMLQEKVVTATNDALENFRRATGLNASISSVVHDASPTDITSVVRASVLNRAGLAIFYNCRRFRVTTSRGRVLFDVSWSIEPDLKKAIKTAGETALTKRTILTEDDVTYITAYDVLLQNGYQLVSISYPGDQGDMAIVSGTGRTARRRYIDIVALKANSALDITESKGAFNLSDVGKAMEAVIAVRDDPSLRSLLLQIVARHVKLSGEPVIASVAFADAVVTGRPTKLDNIDFFVSVTPTQWKLWTHRKDLDLPVTSGTTMLPETWSY